MHVHVLPIKFNNNGKDDFLYPVILQDNTEMILVDCGYAGFMPLLDEAAQQQGLTLSHLTGIIITHHDMDHMGGLHELKARYPSLKIYSSAIDAPYISGRAKSLRLQQTEAMYDSLPEDQKPGALYFQEMLKNVRTVEVDYTFAEDEEPAFLKGVQIVNTPGHMPGHISLYLPGSKTLVAADALVYQEGEFEIANPAFTLDLPAAVASIQKIKPLAMDRIICYHGGIVDNDIQPKLSKLLSKYEKQ